MKAKDVNVGDELYFNPSSTWKTDLWGGAHVVVLDARPLYHRRDRDGKWVTQGGFSAAAKYGILVRQTKKHRRASNMETSKIEMVATLAHLRGQFQPTNEMVQANVAARQAELDRMAGIVAIRKELVGDVLATAGRIGLMAEDAIVGYHSRHVEVQPQPPDSQIRGRRHI